MSTKLGMLVLMAVAALGTGCCFDQCNSYNQCGGAYDPCTGLVANQCDPFAKCREKRIRKKLEKDNCGCNQKGCNCHHRSGHQGGCGCDHGTSMNGGMMGTSGCPTCQSYGGQMETYGEPIYGEPVYGEPIYEGEMETYYEPQSYPELMVPQDSRPMKVVPAPAAEPEELPADSSIPPASYVVPAPLDGPSVPVLQPYHGR